MPAAWLGTTAALERCREDSCLQRGFLGVFLCGAGVLRGLRAASLSSGPLHFKEAPAKKVRTWPEHEASSKTSIKFASVSLCFNWGLLYDGLDMDGWFFLQVKPGLSGHTRALNVRHKRLTKRGDASISQEISHAKSDKQR